MFLTTSYLGHTQVCAKNLSPHLPKYPLFLHIMSQKYDDNLLLPKTIFDYFFYKSQY